MIVSKGHGNHKDGKHRIVKNYQKKDDVVLLAKLVVSTAKTPSTDSKEPSWMGEIFFGSNSDQLLNIYNKKQEYIPVPTAAVATTRHQNQGDVLTGVCVCFWVKGLSAY